jgi:exoribonuclease R
MARINDLIVLRDLARALREGSDRLSEECGWKSALPEIAIEIESTFGNEGERFDREGTAAR